MEVTIKDDEAQKILALAVKSVIEKNSEYFFQTRYASDVTQMVTRIVQSAIERIAQEQVLVILADKNIKGKIVEIVAAQFTDDMIEQLVKKIKIRIDNY